MTHRNYTVIRSSNPDPETYCPANGYIINPLTEDKGWFLLLSFVTNSPSTTTFAPNITGSGKYAWDLGDETIVMEPLSIVHTYADASEKTVKLYGKGICAITSITAQSDHVVGAMNLTNDAFKTLVSFNFNNNLQLTSLLLHPSPTGYFSVMLASGTGISNIDLTAYYKFSSNATIQFYSCPNLETVTLTSTPIEGAIASLALHSNKLTGTLDISIIEKLTSGSSFQFYNNPLLTRLITPASVTGTLSQFMAHSCNLSYTLDLRAYLTVTNLVVWAQDNINLPEILFPTTITGTISTILLTTIGISSLDISMLINWTTTGNLQIAQCPNLATIAFPASGTGTMTALYVANNNILTTALDLSIFTSFAASSTIQVHTNPLVTSVSFYNSIATTFFNIRISDMPLLTTLDLSMFENFVATGGYFNVSNMPNIATLTLPATISGKIVSFAFNNTGDMSNKSLLGYSGIFDINNSAITFSANEFDAATTNRFLYELDEITASGYTGRSINISGTNAAPDSTSGGYDGLAEKAALIAKGFTVTTS